MFFSTAIQSATQEQTVVYPDGSHWVKDNVRGWIMLLPPTSGAAPLPPPDKLDTTKDAAVISGITSKTTNTAALANAQKRVDSVAPVAASKNATAAVNSANKAALNATKASTNASKAALNSTTGANKAIVAASNSAAAAATNATKAANREVSAVAKTAPAPVVNAAAAAATNAAKTANAAAANASAVAASAPAPNAAVPPSNVTAARGGRRTRHAKKNGKSKKNRRY